MPVGRVLGTAGHIDHGKTALVRALTGIDTDRLKEEKQRGITIELGFAHLDLPGLRIGVVDVPGHERFLKSMVAGASGIDLVLMVIAADEGIMPQTREHLAICELLGVERGVVCVTKSDLVDDEWSALVEDEIRAALCDTFLADAKVISVSAKTAAGIDELRDEIARLCHQVTTRSRETSFRLPVDRVFTVKGFGTVVTGTVLGGAVHVGDALVVHPKGHVGKVRGIERHGQAAEHASAGMRCALNLSGVASDQVARGDLLAPPSVVEPSHLIDVRFRYLASSRGALARRSKIIVHHAATQVLATLVLIDRDSLAPGEQCFAQLHLDLGSKLGALPGDHFVARGFAVQAHFGTTVGGGEILRVHAPKAKRSHNEAASTLRSLEGADDKERIAIEVASTVARGATIDHLVRRVGLAHDAVTRALEALEAEGTVRRRHSVWFDRAHAPEPPARRASDDGSADADAGDRRARMSTNGVAAAASDATLLADPLADPIDRALLEAFLSWRLTPPRPSDVAAAISAPPPEVRGALERLLRLGHLVKIKPDYYAARAAIDRLREALVAHLDRQGHVTPQEWKQLVGASRKFAIPLAEHFDAEKLTLRVGDLRKRRG